MDFNRDVPPKGSVFRDRVPNLKVSGSLKRKAGRQFHSSRKRARDEQELNHQNENPFSHLKPSFREPVEGLCSPFTRFKRSKMEADNQIHTSGRLLGNTLMDGNCTIEARNAARRELERAKVSFENRAALAMLSRSGIAFVDFANASIVDEARALATKDADAGFGSGMPVLADSSKGGSYRNHTGLANVHSEYLDSLRTWAFKSSAKSPSLNSDIAPCANNVSWKCLESSLRR